MLPGQSQETTTGSVRHTSVCQYDRNRSAGPSVRQPVSPSFSPSICQSVRQSVSPSADQPVGQPPTPCGALHVLRAVTGSGDRSRQATGPDAARRAYRLLLAATQVPTFVLLRLNIPHSIHIYAPLSYTPWIHTPTHSSVGVQCTARCRLTSATGGRWARPFLRRRGQGGAMIICRVPCRAVPGQNGAATHHRPRRL